MTADPKQARLGQLIAGRYRIEALIGEGGMAIVYRAHHLQLKESVALKVLRPELADDEQTIKRFLREATVAQKIDHPHVVTVYDSGQLPDGLYFLVMELLDGRTLDALLGQQPRLPAARAAAITRQLLDGLGRAHELGIVHRDVKPENTMLLERGGAEIIKLLDFGIAADDAATEKLTGSGVAFGTPEYISPEMAIGEAADGRADLYAAGVMLYEMLAGRRPFVHEDRAALLRAHVQETPPPLESLGVGVAAPLAAVVERAMRKGRSERFPTAKAMSEALDEALAKSPAPAAGKKPPPPPPATPLTSQRLRAAAPTVTKMPTVGRTPYIVAAVALVGLVTLLVIWLR